MIDSHHHIWNLGQNGCTWPTEEEAPIHRDYGLDDFRREALPLGVCATVLIQSQEDDRDTDWLLEVAANDDLVAGVIGWTDLAARDVSRHIAELARKPKLVGLRPMVQHREADWYDDPSLAAGYRAMAIHALRLDALVRVQHLPALDRLAARYPELHIVIDHAAKPEIGKPGEFDRWCSAIAPLAERANIACKLSGLLTECGTSPAEAIVPYAEAVLSLFGPDRVMWGSDWPVLELVSSYGDWLGMAKQLVPDAAHPAVFGKTAVRFYGLETKVAA
ncbi:MAG: amidohydrolase family protein [Pseudomonadota bacterium]|nr:amidohydrolase family protein [Pseudomonadota bacterium]